MYTAVDLVCKLSGAAILAASACFIYLYAPLKTDLIASMFMPICLVAMTGAVVLFFACLTDCVFLNSIPRHKSVLRAVCSLFVLILAAKNGMWMLGPNAASASTLAGKALLEAWPSWTIFLPIFTVASISIGDRSGAVKQPATGSAASRRRR